MPLVAYPPLVVMMLQALLFIECFQFGFDLFFVSLEFLHLAVQLLDEGITLFGFAAEGEETEVVLVSLDFVVEDVQLTSEA